jgi:hypothetical protein
MTRVRGPDPCEQFMEFLPAHPQWLSESPEQWMERLIKMLIN